MRWLYGLVVVLVAFSCMIYELTLAQTSSLLLGNALLNYSVTICIYLAALGAGSLLYMRLQSLGLGRVFLDTEIILSYLGPCSPLLVMFAEVAFRQIFLPGTPAYNSSLQVTMYGLVAIVGVLSGLELPIMMSIGESRFRLQSGAVLGLDYAGTLVAIAVFPTLGLAYLGMFGVAALAGVGSWVGAAMTAASLPPEERRSRDLILLAPSLFLILSMLFFQKDLTEFMSQAVYLYARTP